MRALPRCAAESSICSINYNSPPLPHPCRTLPPVSFQWPRYTWVKSRKPHSALWLMQSHTTCIPLPLLDLHPLTPPGHTHTRARGQIHTDRYTPPQTIPCWYLDALSIRKWKWEREQIMALCHLRCLVHVVRFFLAAELMWWVNRFTDGEIVGPKRTEVYSVCGMTCTFAVSGLCCARVVVATYCSYLNPKITSAQLGLFSCCSHGGMVKLYQRLSLTYFTTFWPAISWDVGRSLPLELGVRAGQCP